MYQNPSENKQLAKVGICSATGLPVPLARLQANENGKITIGPWTCVCTENTNCQGIPFAVRTATQILVPEEPVL